MAQLAQLSLICAIKIDKCLQLPQHPTAYMLYCRLICRYISTRKKIYAKNNNEKKKRKMIFHRKKREPRKSPRVYRLLHRTPKPLSL